MLVMKKKNWLPRVHGMCCKLIACRATWQSALSRTIHSLNKYLRLYFLHVFSVHLRHTEDCGNQMCDQRSSVGISLNDYIWPWHLVGRNDKKFIQSYLTLCPGWFGFSQTTFARVQVQSLCFKNFLFFLLRKIKICKKKIPPISILQKQH